MDYALTVREKTAPADPGEVEPLRWWDWLVHRRAERPDDADPCEWAEGWNPVAEGCSWTGLEEAQAMTQVACAVSALFALDRTLTRERLTDAVGAQFLTFPLHPCFTEWVEVEPD